MNTTNPTHPTAPASMAAHTPTPWYWHTDHAGRVSIRTPDRGNLIVMDFVRQGMNSAAPRFAHWEGMDLGAPRGRMGGILECSIDHPDAAFIVRACNSHAALVEALSAMYCAGFWTADELPNLPDYQRKAIAQARAALTAAQS